MLRGILTLAAAPAVANAKHAVAAQSTSWRAAKDTQTPSSSRAEEDMADYTIKNLKDDVEDAAVQFGLSPNLEARFAVKALECEKLGLSYQRLAPGFRVPFGHSHAGQEEIYVVVEGGGRVRLDDEVRDVRQWDAVRVAAETVRAFEAGPGGAVILAVGAPAGEAAGNDAQMIQDWWSD
jgi:quercetin dioxygenase-like cupin family protein